MNFIRENLLKIVVVLIIIIIVTIVMASCGSKVVTLTQRYEEMENTFKEKAISFVSEHKEFLPKQINESSKLNMRTLISNEVMKPYYANEDKNVSCTGYVSITKKEANSYKYTPFIKCGKYYETKTLANYIISNNEIVTSEDGLYKYENTYVYRGEIPNNYLIIGEKTYRIISIDANEEIKVIDTKRYSGSFEWDDRYNSEVGKDVGINDYEKSRIKEYLNEIYVEDTDYTTSLLKSFIVPHDICVGKVSQNNTDFSGNVECQATSENQYYGLIQLNEFFRASIDSGCASIKSPECGNYNYINTFSNGYIATQNAVLENSYEFLSISDGVAINRRTSNTFNPYITFYLDSNTLYKTGDGSKLNPYQIR